MSSKVESEEGSSARGRGGDDRTKRQEIEPPLEIPAETPVLNNQVPEVEQPGSKKVNPSIAKWRTVIQSALLTLGEPELRNAAFEALDSIALASSELNLMVARLEGKLESVKSFRSDEKSNLKASTASSERPSYAAVTRGLYAPKAQIKKIFR